jgi:outer membrane protein assembly factor BamA
MFIPLWYLAAALALAAPSAESAVVRIAATAMPDGPADDIRRLAKTLEPSQLTDTIAALLNAEGYLRPVLSTVGDTIIIDPGILFRLGDINLALIAADGTVARKSYPAFRRLPASRQSVVRFKEAIVAEYQDAGYYFASLSTDSVSFAEDDVSFNLRLITGPLVRIGQVRFKGLTRTDPGFVRRLSGIREGDPFVAGQVDDAVRKITARGFLQNDSMPQVTPNEAYDAVELLFHLTEMKSNSLELGGGYLPRQGDRSGEVIGRFRFRSNNLFGSGRKIDLLFERKDRRSSRLEFGFAQPFFVPDLLEATLHIQQVDFDSSYYSFTAEGGVTLFTAAGAGLTGTVSWTKTDPQRLARPPLHLLKGTVSYSANALDYRPNPKSGRQVILAASYIRRSSRPDSAATAVVDDESMFHIAADNYFHLGRGVVLRLNADALVLITSRDLIDYSEQFKLGGYGSLRGYREAQFAGHRVALGQVEIRFRPSPNASLYVFSDVGYIYSMAELSPGKGTAQELVRNGSGVGLYVGSGGARMTLEIGWGRDDRVGDGKLHVGLVTLF